MPPAVSVAEAARGLINGMQELRVENGGDFRHTGGYDLVR